LFSNDDGNADLLDAQYFVFNLLLLAFFVVVFLGNETAGLPQLPSNLVALTGIGSAGYLAKKTQETGWVHERQPAANRPDRLDVQMSVRRSS
jgi:hypothetical protein